MDNPVLDQLFRQMAWANNKLFIQLSELPEEALSYSGWNPDWTVGKLANHIVFGQGRFIARLQKQPVPTEAEFPFTSAGMKQLASSSVANDEKLLALLNTPTEMLTFARFGETVQFSSTTVLAQPVHHATEHRAQIADILAMNNMDVINLDALDHWTYERSL